MSLETSMNYVLLVSKNFPFQPSLVYSARKRSFRLGMLMDSLHPEFSAEKSIFLNPFDHQKNSFYNRLCMISFTESNPSLTQVWRFGKLYFFNLF